MEIEKLIERLQNWDGIKPDREIDCTIEGLKALQAENNRLRRERDAAVESWRGFCSQCAWKNHQYLADGKMDDRCRTCRDNAKCNWKWRGPKEE